MRKVLFLLSPGSEISLEELFAASDFSDFSAQAVILNKSAGSEKSFPFPCFLLGSNEKIPEFSYPPIDYPDVLRMVFEADTIIS